MWQSCAAPHISADFLLSSLVLFLLTVFLEMYLFLAALLLASTAASLPQTHISAASGCGKTQLLPGVTQYRFGLTSSGKSRSYSYHLPSSYDKNKKYPVVLGFHGSSSIGLFFEMDTKMSEARFSSEKIMVYPNGIDGSWAGPSYHNGSTVAEDVQFVADIVQDVEAKFCVDESKIYGVGYVMFQSITCTAV
jgi:poly(3-hydroxybutyrate) depolymerase